MRNLLLGVFALVLVGIAGFLYRSTIEQHAGPVMRACTAEAKICPDGSSVGRTGPSCAFAACPAGNVEDQDSGIAFALPPGYVEDAGVSPADPSLIGAYVKTASSTDEVAATITVRRYPIPEEQTAAQVMLDETLLEPSDMHPKDANAFTPKVIGTHTFSSIVVERFEGHVHSAYYYLDRPGEVIRFDVLETGVEGWSDAKLVVDSLPEHQALLRMLASLQVYAR